ncbi:adenosylcobinamide-phosphate synthase CbiB [Phreatobacter sp. AB_2022a]|uniref:adenosylcobinamide-phosphate synthase CbiB n=1 Tax=Phreatobacter sp. AB_2022a TaxID=3003134 RepID=UPI002287323C|nr:adenosylcobinamide-phosphate synthase CbiB [Phreatobacter sp. AB_2022a]MCZ0736591.1 adenosylcobinamide-phosphate synthase CbiB [Phreatobacter sp. AB_2022a]
MSEFSPLVLACLALAIEAAVGYPGSLYAAIGHPVTWIGRLIALFDRRLNLEGRAFAERRRAGILAVALLIGATLAVSVAIVAVSGWLGLPGFVLLGVVASSLLAQRSLHDHVADVAAALETGGLAAGREAVAMIVGRNPQSLDMAGVSRAAIESLAENFSDGVTAPAFWLGLFGLPGAALYKAINTADSMIGHRTPRHEAFGWAAARLDDLVNLPASRLTALLIVAAAAFEDRAAASRALGAIRRDARHHKSPNAGWPEAAMAGALGLRLAGPRVYGEARIDDRWMGDGRAEATAADIRRALALYRRACILLWALIASTAVAAASL